MTQRSPFTIYDAAAGSGKTFTLVKEYLKTILLSKKDGYYKNLLAVTFTNKAVAEMKDRIIKALVYFSDEGQDNKGLESMLESISDETRLTKAEIKQRSNGILKHLLHNYSAFSVETIDRFNHRLIRTFARDLKLATNFEVSLDTQQLLAEAVDKLISRAGETEQITKILLDFALEKTDEEKSWDISKDIAAASKILTNENDIPHVAELRDKTLEDFSVFKDFLLKKTKKLDKEIFQKASEVLERLKTEGLEFNDFNRGTLPNHFLKLQAGDYNAYDNQLGQNLVEENWSKFYTAKTPKVAVDTIIEILPYLRDTYILLKAFVFEQKLYASALKNLTPLSVINLVNQELELIKEEKNLLPISEFNSLINKEIKNQPAPFIYERLGERYRHFFVDEFQDTSTMQWENLIPLIDNSLAQSQDGKQGSLLLVGDAKQSIYRWRGGVPEQFMELNLDKNPFPNVPKNLQNLDTNRRSRKEIVTFNNDFFSFLANHFGDSIHKNLYVTGNRQQTNSKSGGYVKVEFIEKQNKTEKHVAYGELVYETIENAKTHKYQERDICILTRTRNDGIALSSYLMDRGISVISSETLLLQQSKLVQILVNTLTYSLFAENEEVKINLLGLLHEHFTIQEEKHSFFSKFLKSSAEGFSEKLKEYSIDFDSKTLKSSSLFEGFEYCIRQFQLNKNPDAYLFGFMDFVFEFEQKPNAGKIAFLEYWETKREKSSIAASEGINAVQLMTIHKAKGLEFPIVIFPYADIELYGERNAKTWFPLPENETNFSETLINFNNDVSEFGEEGMEIYNKRRNTLELDNINLLYVALTRAVDQLYVFAEMPTGPKDGTPNTYNHLFKLYFDKMGKWDGSQSVYEFGEIPEKVQEQIDKNAKQFTPIYISTKPEDHNLHIVTKEALLWDSLLSESIAGGNLLHDSMERIKTMSDASLIFQEYQQRNILTSEELGILTETILSIIKHPDLKHLFNGEDNVMNERELITSEGIVLRPDRLNFHQNRKVTIVDYKTGGIKPQHEAQLTNYADALKEMGYTIIEMIVVYASGNGILINKV